MIQDKQNALHRISLAHRAYLLHSKDCSPYNLPLVYISYIMLAIITVCISDLQALNDLLVFYNEYQELERYITRLLFVLNDLCIFDVHFKMHVMTKRSPKIVSFFMNEMLCH